MNVELKDAEDAVSGHRGTDSGGPPMHSNKLRPSDDNQTRGTDDLPQPLRILSPFLFLFNAKNTNALNFFADFSAALKETTEFVRLFCLFGHLG